MISEVNVQCSDESRARSSQLEEMLFSRCGNQMFGKSVEKSKNQSAGFSDASLQILQFNHRC